MLDTVAAVRVFMFIGILVFVCGCVSAAISTEQKHRKSKRWKLQIIGFTLAIVGIAIFVATVHLAPEYIRVSAFDFPDLFTRPLSSAHR